MIRFRCAIGVTLSFPFKCPLLLTTSDHCIDALRQTLMCHGDISPLPFRINEHTDMWTPYFATRHQCRDFDKIKQWAIDHRASKFDNHAPGPERKEELKKLVVG